jgi:hypothetical protein
MKKIYYILLLELILFSINLNAQIVYQVTALDNPSPGYIRLDGDGSQSFFLLDNYGNKLFEMDGIDRNVFKLLQNGMWARFTQTKYYLYNENMQLVDSIANPSMYSLDFHDILLLNNGHYLLLCEESNIVDMSKYVEGGKTDATIFSDVLIEVDKTTGSISWTWKAINHVSPLDATDIIPLTDQAIRLTHANSLFEDNDGNIIISFRHLDEVSKINKTTGEFVWRMGGSKCRNNQFTFVNDTDENGFVGFSHQHTATITNTGTLLLFDNGVLKPHQYSRAVEYQVDFVNKVATKIWEYRYQPDKFTLSMGSAYRLPNGNTLINWCLGTVTEVKPDGTKAFELSFNATPAYRAYRYVTRMNAVLKQVTSNGNYSFNDSKYTTGVSLNISQKSGNGSISVEKHNYRPATAYFIDSSFSNILPFRWVISKNGINSFSATLKIQANTIENIGNPNKVTIYYRPKEASGYFSKLQTSYNSSTGELSANISDGGEYLICTNLLDIPKLIAPVKNGLYKSQDTLIWTSVIGANKYEIQLDTTMTFSNPYKITSTNSYTVISNLNFNTFYYWRVRAMNSVDTSAWSEVSFFITTLANPKLNFPGNNAVAIHLNDSLKWQPTNGALFYWVQVAQDPDFSMMVIESPKEIRTSISISKLKNFTKYFWRVMACKNTDSSNWSQMYNFTTCIATPNLSTPENNQINIPSNVDLIWQQVSGAKEYNIQLADNLNFSNCLINNSVKLLTVPYDKCLTGAEYYWRVRAIRDDDTSSWSDVYHFSSLLKEPILIYPDNQTINIPIKLTFDWDSPAQADFYDFQLATDYQFKNLVVDTTKLSQNQISIPKLSYMTRYYWRVKTFIGNKFSDWTNYYTFVTEAPKALPTPQLIEPVQYSWNLTSVKFVWNRVEFAEKYQLQISTNYYFSNIQLDTLLRFDTLFNVTKLKYFSTYFWRVRAISGKDTSEWTQPNMFYTISQTHPVMLFIPGNDNLNTSLTGKLMWFLISGIDYYNVQLSTDSNFVDNLYEIKQVDSNFIAYSNLELRTKYYWRVRYIKNQIASNWSYTFSFTTITLDTLQRAICLEPNFQNKPIPVSGKLVWSSVPNAKSYNVSISDNYYFIEKFTTFKNIQDTIFSYSDFDYNKFYFWRVSAENDNAESAWSHRSSFITELKAPQIIHPTENNKIINTKGQIIWTKEDDFSSFQIQFAKDPDFNEIALDVDSLDIQKYDFALEPNTNYFCRVRSYNYWNLSRWSNVVTFTTDDGTNVKENNLAEISIYPNPANDDIFINFNSNEIKKILLYDIFGNILLNKDTTDLSMKINLKGLSSGIYFIRIGNIVKSFVKQ